MFLLTPTARPQSRWSTPFALASIVALTLTLGGCSSADEPVTEPAPTTATESAVPVETTPAAPRPFTFDSRCSTVGDYEPAEQVDKVREMLAETGNLAEGFDVESFVTEWCVPSNNSLLDTLAAYHDSNREHLTYDMVTTQGYTYTLDVEIPSRIDVDREVATQKPGEVMLTMSYPVDATVTNTTAERETSYVAWALVPVWDSSSLLCQLESPNTAGRINLIDDPSASLIIYEESDYCWMQAATLVLSGRNYGFDGNIVSAKLAPGETAELAESIGKGQSATSIGTIVVTEDVEEQITAELAQPLFWMLSPNQAMAMTEQPITACLAIGNSDLPREYGGSHNAVYRTLITTSAGKAICGA